MQDDQPSSAPESVPGEILKAPSAVSTPPKKPSHKKKWLVVAVVFVVALAGGIVWYLHSIHKHPAASPSTAVSQAPLTAAPVTTLSSSDLKLDENKNYGNKYANGILPVGDKKYTTTGPKTGYVYLCHVPQGGEGGAGTRGPWFTNNNTEYDINKKAKVAGSVSWQSNYNLTITGTTRKIYTNDLPTNHTTGVFPVQKTDPAYAYDRNPNSIAAQSLTYNLAANPTVGTNSCMGGEVGVMNTGVALFNGFDAGGRDAGAWEVQDGCSGHPQNTHEYHYHTLSNCINDTSVKTVIGYALDGFPITGPKLSDSNILTTSDLDECHGITSQIVLDGKDVISYHYVMTQDFPYSVSCFKAQATQPPGQPERH